MYIGINEGSVQRSGDNGVRDVGPRLLAFTRWLERVLAEDLDELETTQSDCEDDVLGVDAQDDLEEKLRQGDVLVQNSVVEEGVVLARAYQPGLKEVHEELVGHATDLTAGAIEAQGEGRDGILLPADGSTELDHVSDDCGRHDRRGDRVGEDRGLLVGAIVSIDKVLGDRGRGARRDGSIDSTADLDVVRIGGKHMDAHDELSTGVSVCVCVCVPVRPAPISPRKGARAW